MAEDSALRTSFGRVLLDLRTKRGLSQEALAFDSDLDRTFVSMLERGVRQPTLATLFALAAVLNVRPSRIVSLTEKGLGRRSQK
jgi:transcriptional regulator with XRE-family HTH domain